MSAFNFVHMPFEKGNPLLVIVFLWNSPIVNKYLVLALHFFQNAFTDLISLEGIY